MFHTKIKIHNGRHSTVGSLHFILIFNHDVVISIFFWSLNIISYFVEIKIL